MTAEDRFMAKTEPEPNSGCLMWVGAGEKYGLFWNGEKMVGAHRWAYEHFVGPLGVLEPDHLCLVTRCVNWAHLRATTPHLNRSNHRSFNAAKTHCPSGHDYSVHGRKFRRRGRNERACRECNNERNRRRV